ncbi:MAG: PIN domain-containing protein [Candidatus Desulfofervidaceae bacterium]|nr:PIN domain-containing protein [Candidatus Desulfofervidaceae bacterium]
MQSKKNTIAIDVNIILRYLLKDNEELYFLANNFFEAVFSGEKIAYVLQSVLAEVIYVLIKLYKVEKEQVVEVLEEFLSNKNIKVQDKDVTMTAIHLFKTSNIDFVDCLLCAYSKKMEIFSFDKKLDKCSEELKSRFPKIRDLFLDKVF